MENIFEQLEEMNRRGRADAGRSNPSIKDEILVSGTIVKHLLSIHAHPVVGTVKAVRAVKKGFGDS
ncbi:MAG: hypothetical protein ACJ786_41105 [Catenulispora sp.]